MKKEFKAEPVSNWLIKHHGNITAVAAELGAHRNTVRRHARDFECENHCVVNGKLMSWSPLRNGKKGD